MSGNACRRQEKRSVIRLAILPFENLTGDPALDYAGPAVATILASEISGSTHTFPLRVPAGRDALAAQAGQVLSGYFDRRGGQLRFYAVIHDAIAHRVVTQYEASGAPAALEAIADSIAKAMHERLRPFNVQNPEAIRAWGEAMIAPEASARTAGLERAVQLDPNFGAAYVDLLQTWQSAGNREQMNRVVALAKPRLNLFSDLDRAKVELYEAQLSGNQEERRRSLVAISRLVSTDSGTLRALAEMEFDRRNFPAAVELYKNALALLPDDPAMLNQLGYAEALRGNLPGARAALERARDLQPEQQNALDSLGEVHYFLGRFAEAEKYFLDAQSRNPAFLGGLEQLKAAQARLMQGNPRGADELFQKYAALRQSGHDATIGIQQIQWQYLTGHRQQALAALEAAANGGGNLGAYASVQLSLWLMAAGDTGHAQASAARALHAQDTGMRNLGIVAQFLTTPKSNPAEWSSAADRLFGSAVAPDTKQLMLAYGLLYGKMYGAAAPVLKTLYERTQPGSDGQIRALYAWSLAASGKLDEAAPLLERYIIPMNGTETLFTSMVFPRFLGLRADLRARRGRADEAKAARTLFVLYGGENHP